MHSTGRTTLSARLWFGGFGILAQVALTVAFPPAGFYAGRAATGLTLSLTLSTLAGVGFGRLVRRLAEAGYLGTVLSASALLVITNYVVYLGSWFIAAEIFAPDRSLVYEPVLGLIVGLIVVMVYSGWVGFPAGLLAGYLYYRWQKSTEEE